MNLADKISLKSEGQNIDGHLFIPTHGKAPYPAVLFLHGSTSSEKNYIPIAEKLADLGIAAMTINLRGHGTSEGNFDSLTVEDSVKDGLAALETLVRNPIIDKNRLGICGASLGAAIAALMVEENNNIKSLVLRVPATYTTEMLKMKYPDIMSDEERIFKEMAVHDTPPIKAMRNFRGSLLVITSQNDDIIPPKVSLAFLSAAAHANKKELKEIPEATHQLTNDKWRAQFREWTLDWFQRTL